ncbi:hydroxyproline dehydrogenase-like isoform X2 [Panulirus ornatus]|uniref:hydroxyproline dehydrogenase-like isoform X2 n=1 Tax=Panulirus ornatus TaxID=150431 RepID=UPI003A842393
MKDSPGRTLTTVHLPLLPKPITPFVPSFYLIALPPPYPPALSPPRPRSIAHCDDSPESVSLLVAPVFPPQLKTDSLRTCIPLLEPVVQPQIQDLPRSKKKLVNGAVFRHKILVQQQPSDDLTTSCQHNWPFKGKQWSVKRRRVIFIVSSSSMAASVLRCVRVIRQLLPVRGVAVHCPAAVSVRQSREYVSVAATANPGTARQPQKKDVTKSAVTELNFGDHSTAFRHKTARELLRGLVVLHACAFDPLVNRSYKLMTLGQRILGQRILRYVLAPFYNQFVAGDSEEELGIVSRRLASVGVSLMVAPMLETDVGEGHDVREMYTKNLNKTLHLIDTSHRNNVVEGSRPICQTKITAHLTADILARISTLYQSLNFEGRVQAVRSVAALLSQAGGNGHSISTADAKSLQPLLTSPSDAHDFIDCFQRLYKLGKRCVEQGVVLAVDAEYTYTNPAINLVTLAMMKVFNTPTPIIWNTYQGYLKAGRENLEHDLAVVRALGSGVGFGAKLVRGAYLEKERSLAQKEGYPDPVNDTYEDTNAVYNSMVEVMLREVAEAPLTRAVVVATHNESSVKLAATKMEQLELDPRAGNVVFGQVYGMAENISVPLAGQGFLVYKSIPSGSLLEVMPYLSRRANENRAVLRGARRERQLLSQELLSRVPFSHLYKK